jgi:tetratricopeptide (TPR) repeat protein
MPVERTISSAKIASRSLTRALLETERRVEASQDELTGLRLSCERIFETPPVEWTEDRLRHLKEILERRTEQSALPLRNLLGSILTIEWSEEGLLRVDDFFEGSFRNVRTRLRPVGGGRFITDIAGVEPVFDQSPGAAAGVTLNWRGIKAYAGRAPEGHRLPMELFADGLTVEAVEAFCAQKDFYIKEVPEFEAQINRMGYTLLRDEEYEEAIAVFAMNVDFFPESFDTYDSLGEADMESGRTQQAIQDNEKALELNPGGENAKRMLKRLRKKV